MSSFEEWYRKEFNPTVSDDLFENYIKKGEIYNVMRVCFEAGWNVCRDKWGGMTYEETLEHEQSG